MLLTGFPYYPTADYEEDIEGFQFSRASRSKKLRLSPEVEDPPLQQQPAKKPREKPKAKVTKVREATRSASRSPSNHVAEEPARRRSRRLASNDPDVPEKPSRQKRKDPDTTITSTTKKRRPQKRKDPDVPVHEPPPDEEHDAATPQQQPAGTKIALPFADTPVIQRNKEMRKDRGRSQRRSSLGMRGRRASSLIDSGASNGIKLPFLHSTMAVAKQLQSTTT